MNILTNTYLCLVQPWALVVDVFVVGEVVVEAVVEVVVEVAVVKVANVVEMP